MSIKDLLGLGSEIAKPIEAVSNLYTTDKERMSAQAKLDEIEQNPAKWQALINLVNAKSVRFFDSGWRPMLGWTCGACVAMYYIPQLVLANYIWYKLCIEQHKILTFPISPNDILNLVYLLLGMGVIKTVENKLK